jgi:hypothetical protein
LIGAFADKVLDSLPIQKASTSMAPAWLERGYSLFEPHPLT